jgi:hypothetical protein
MRLRAWLSLTLAVALVGCGGGPSADEVLSETAANLGKIRSGTLIFKLLVDPRAKGAEGDFGFELQGPFSFGTAEEPPRARIAYTQVSDGRRATATLVLDGDEAYALVNGERRELGDDAAAELRAAAEELRGPGGTFGEVQIGDWIVDPKRSDGGEVGGAETDKVEAELDVVAVVNDLLAIARQFGTEVPALRGRSARQLARAARSSKFELWSGKDDRLLRRLKMEVEFGLDVPEQLREAVGDVVGATVRFELGVGKPNEPIGDVTR